MQIMGPIGEVVAGALAGITGLGSDTGAAKYLRLFKNDVDISVNTVLEDLETADFDGYADVAVAVATGVVGFDPLSLNREVVIPLASGGAVFQVSGGVTNLPQTIFGWALLNHAKTEVVGAQRFDAPIHLIAMDQMITVDKVSVEFSDSAFA